MARRYGSGRLSRMSVSEDLGDGVKKTESKFTRGQIVRFTEDAIMRRREDPRREGVVLAVSNGIARVQFRDAEDVEEIVESDLEAA